VFASGKKRRAERLSVPLAIELGLKTVEFFLVTGHGPFASDGYSTCSVSTPR